jgi:hypothetical protein
MDSPVDFLASERAVIHEGVLVSRLVRRVRREEQQQMCRQAKRLLREHHREGSL